MNAFMSRFIFRESIAADMPMTFDLVMPPAIMRRDRRFLAVSCRTRRVGLLRLPDGAHQETTLSIVLRDLARRGLDRDDSPMMNTCRCSRTAASRARSRRCDVLLDFVLVSPRATAAFTPVNARDPCCSTGTGGNRRDLIFLLRLRGPARGAITPKAKAASAPCTLLCGRCGCFIWTILSLEFGGSQRDPRRTPARRRPMLANRPFIGNCAEARNCRAPGDGTSAASGLFTQPATASTGPPGKATMQTPRHPPAQDRRAVLPASIGLATMCVACGSRPRMHRRGPRRGLTRSRAESGTWLAHATSTTNVARFPLVPTLRWRPQSYLAWSPNGPMDSARNAALRRRHAPAALRPGTPACCRTARSSPIGAYCARSDSDQIRACRLARFGARARPRTRPHRFALVFRAALRRWLPLDQKKGPAGYPAGPWIALPARATAKV